MRAPWPDRPLLQLRCLREAADERVELAGLVQCKDALQYMKLWATANECVWQVATAGAKNVEQQGLTQLSGMQEWSALVFFLDGTPTQASAMERLKATPCETSAVSLTVAL